MEIYLEWDDAIATLCMHAISKSRFRDKGGRQGDIPLHYALGSLTLIYVYLPSSRRDAGKGELFLNDNKDSNFVFAALQVFIEIICTELRSLYISDYIYRGCIKIGAACSPLNTTPQHPSHLIHTLVFDFLNHPAILM